MAMLSLPAIPKTKIRWQGSNTPRIPPSASATVAVIVGEHDWGPTGAELGEIEAMADFSEFTDLYGDSDTPARTAVAQAFIGQGLQGAGGAGGVIVVRMAPGAAQSTLTIQNTAGTPVDALTLKGRWKGVLGNQYSIKIDDDPAATSTRDRLRVYFKGALLDTFVYPNANIAQLAADITARDNFPLVVSGAVVTGTPLAATSGTSLAGGTNGTTVTSSDYVAAAQVLEFEAFFGLAPYNLTDDATFTALASWIAAQDEANRPVILSVGGGDSDTVAAAITRSALFGDPHVVNFGVGRYYDQLLDKTLNTAQLAPRIIGILAARGEKAALTGSLLGGLTPVGGAAPTELEAKSAAEGGVTTVVRTDSDEASLRIARGVTTFVSTTDANRPKRIFSEPRFIRIMDNFVREFRKWGDEKIIGALPVNDDTRAAVRQKGTEMITRLVNDGLLLTKAQGASLDPFIRTISTTDDTIPFEFGWQFAETANFLIGTGSVR